MKSICFLISVMALLSGCATGQTKEDVIQKVWDGAGGKKTWEDSRYLTFTFAPQRDGKTLIKRTHLWDRYTGNYRFEGTTAANESLLVLFNVNTRKGKSFINGEPLADSLNNVQVTKAYGYYINDAYWLIAPLKLQDPGVNVNLEDEEDVDGTLCPVLHLTFNNVGLTSGDQYWLYVNPENGQIKRWKFLLEGQKEPGIFNWTDYKDLGGGLNLATTKQNVNQNQAITFPVASVLVSVEKGKFTKK